MILGRSGDTIGKLFSLRAFRRGHWRLGGLVCYVAARMRVIARVTAASSCARKRLLTRVRVREWRFEQSFSSNCSGKRLRVSLVALLRGCPLISLC